MWRCVFVRFCKYVNINNLRCLQIAFRVIFKVFKGSGHIFFINFLKYSENKKKKLYICSFEIVPLRVKR